MYVDSAYIAKHYLNEPDSAQVRRLMADADTLISSVWAIAEVTCAFHRQLREGRLDAEEFSLVANRFSEHVEAGVWQFAPVTDLLLRKMSAFLRSLPASAYIRAGDALHLATAWDLGEREIWSNDRHLLAAAPHFGLVGRSV